MTPTTGPMAAVLDGLEDALANLGDEIEGYSVSENGGHVFDPKDTFIGDHLRLCDLRVLQQALARRAVGGGGEVRDAIKAVEARFTPEDRKVMADFLADAPAQAEIERLREEVSDLTHSERAAKRLANERGADLQDWQTRALAAEEQVKVLSEALERILDGGYVSSSIEEERADYLFALAALQQKEKPDVR